MEHQPHLFSDLGVPTCLHRGQLLLKTESTTVWVVPWVEGVCDKSFVLVQRWAGPCVQRTSRLTGRKKWGDSNSDFQRQSRLVSSGTLVEAEADKNEHYFCARQKWKACSYGDGVKSPRQLCEAGKVLLTPLMRGLRWDEI